MLLHILMINLSQIQKLLTQTYTGNTSKEPVRQKVLFAPSPLLKKKIIETFQPIFFDAPSSVTPKQFFNKVICHISNAQ